MERRASRAPGAAVEYLFMHNLARWGGQAEPGGGA